MRKFNKIKLLTSLSSIGLVATSVPVIATSCTTSPVLYGPNPNDTTIEISQIRWIKQKIYNFNTESEIITKVKKDNRYIYSNYPGLEEATTITAIFNSSSNEIDITIKVTDFEQTKYIQSGDPVSWSATYVSPTPTSKTDLGNLNWSMRSEHTSNNTETIIAEIKTDNQDGKGADITSWDNINVSVTLNGTNISINIVANENNLNYKGNVRWSAKYVPTKTDLASLSWKMRPLYTSNVVNTIKSTITSDNSGISGVANLTYNITVNGSYIGISIYAPDSNTTYKGGVQWSARYSASDVYVTGSAHNVAYKAYTASSGGSTVDTGQGWWRTWSDGVIEQGGILSVPATEAYITLMKNYTSVNNMVVLATSSATSSPVMGKANAYNQVKIDFDGQITGLASWYCIGW